MTADRVDALQFLLVAALIIGAFGWYLSYTAARLDRLHAKVEGGIFALDAQLLRRAETALELGTSGHLDPASALLVTTAATESLDRITEQPTSGDLLDGRNFGHREDVESDLTQVLNAALTPDVVTTLRSDPDGFGREMLETLESRFEKVAYARQFLNQAVREVRRIRRRRIVRFFHLAGRAQLPTPVDFDDALPESLAHPRRGVRPD